jgi:hypothetical protein
MQSAWVDRPIGLTTAPARTQAITNRLLEIHMKSTRVETVRGAIPADALGTVYIHEHVFVLSPDVLTNYPSLWNEEERVADAVARLRALKDRGVDTIADPTVLGLGRRHPPRGTGQRTGRFEHRPGDRALHLQRCAAVLLLPRAGNTSRR